MSTLGLIDFTDVEKEVMMYITRKSGKLCTIHSIFNDIIKDRNITDPEIKNDLKVKLQIVMSQLNFVQSNVNVVKNGDSYLVGYNMDSTENVQIDEDVDVEYTQDIDTSQLAKSMFEYIVDNDIEYNINPNTPDNNLLVIGLKLGDYNRIKKLQTKYPVSFFDKNLQGETIMEMYRISMSSSTTLFIHQQCLNELKLQFENFRFRENHLLNYVIRLDNEFIELENQIAEIKKKNMQKSFYDLYSIIMVFVAIWYLMSI